MDQPQVDFSRLYGDLCKKLLSTPVGEIFPNVVTGSTTNHVTSSAGSTSPSSIHPAFPAFSAMDPNQMSYLTNLYSQNGFLLAPVGLQSGLPVQEAVDSDRISHPLGGATMQKGSSDITKSPSFSPGSEASIESMESVDVQKLVDEFKVTLERYGVSQRFAARFIMQDTSQGNLSFLMEKGRNKKWEELSPRGRLPYIKMKAWLENKEHQMMTLDMLKHTQESRKNCTRESYNRRERFTMFQLNVLCRLFEENSNPPMNIRNSVAVRLGIPLDRVNVWFQNQRARGFPARKILQQTIYDNESDPYLAIDVENMKDKINEANLVPQAYSVNTESPSQWTDRNRNKKPSPKIPSPKMPSPKMSNIFSPVNHNVSSTSIKSEPGDIAFPLDLSSSSNLDVSRGSGAYKSVTVPYAGERYQDVKPNGVHTDFDVARTSIEYSTSQTVSFVKPATSGAAKRKRGTKPQQIIPICTHETATETECQKTNENKRRKLIEISSPEKNYTYLLDTADIKDETPYQNGNTSRDYDYVIKSEHIPNGNTANISQSNDEGCKDLHKLEHTMSNEFDSNKYEQFNSNRYGHCASPEVKASINVSKEETLPPKSIEIFKAMCASLAFTKENNADVSLNEPELD